MAIAPLGGMIGRNFYHFENALSYVDYSHRIQKISVGLHQSIIGYLLENQNEIRPAALTETLRDMQELMMDERYLSAATKTHLAELKAILQGVTELKPDEKNAHLSKALKIMDETLEFEALQREKSLEEINFDTQNELYIALAMFTLIVVGAVVFLYRRILHPLNDLRKLLERLTEADFTPITTDHLDPLLLPVFKSYNVTARPGGTARSSSRTAPPHAARGSAAWPPPPPPRGRRGCPRRAAARAGPAARRRH